MWAKFIPILTPPSPLRGQKLTFHLLSTLCHVSPCGLSTDPHRPLLVHVVIECPQGPTTYSFCARINNQSSSSVSQVNIKVRLVFSLP